MFLDRVNHADTKEETKSKTLKEYGDGVLELNAKNEAEALTVFAKNGHPDHTFNEQLRQCFVNKDGIVNWRLTLELRKKMVAEYDWRREL